MHDPYADADEAMSEYGLSLLAWDELPIADAIVAAVAHKQITSRPNENFIMKLVPGGCFIDVKACFDPKPFESAGAKVWRL